MILIDNPMKLHGWQWKKKTDLIAIPELSEWKKKWKENCHECVGVIKAPDVDLKNETKFLL